MLGLVLVKEKKLVSGWPSGIGVGVSEYFCRIQVQKHSIVKVYSKIEHLDKYIEKSIEWSNGLLAGALVSAEQFIK